MSFDRVNGLHLRHWPGDADRTGLVLHCMMCSGAGWGPVAAALDGHIDLHGFDLPGHGRSTAWQPVPDVDYHTHVTRLAAQMIDRPIDLIGHSFGATVALRIAVGAPQAIRTLTLIEPVLFAAAPRDACARTAALHDDMARALDEGRDEDAARVFLAGWGTARWDDLPDSARCSMARQVRLVADTVAALTEDRHRILRPTGLEGILAPVMIVTGEDSPPVMAAIAEALAARLPDVGRATVPGAGHMLPLTHPQQTAGLILANLDRG